MAIIIDQARELARVGSIRMGERKQPNRPGFQRDTFRFTSANKAALIELQKAYCGKLTAWPEKPGEWELDSEAGQISVVVDTTLSVDDFFKQFDGKTCSHKCDGVNCEFVEIERGRDKKIIKCVEHGFVPCLCDPEGLQGALPAKQRRCEKRTTLRVMLPATGDVMLWEFSSKGEIFNKEVHAAVDTFKQLGMRQCYCHLAIHRLEKTRGNDVSKFGVASLTLDPNPPNMVAALLGRTPQAQAAAFNAAQALPSAAPTLGASTDSAKERTKDAAEWMTKVLGMKGDAKRDFATLAGTLWFETALEAKDDGATTAEELTEFAKRKIAEASTEGETDAEFKVIEEATDDIPDDRDRYDDAGNEITDPAEVARRREERLARQSEGEGLF